MILTHDRHCYRMTSERTLVSSKDTRSQSIWWSRLRGQERFPVPRHWSHLHGLPPMAEVISSQSKAKKHGDQGRDQVRTWGEGVSHRLWLFWFEAFWWAKICSDSTREKGMSCMWVWYLVDISCALDVTIGIFWQRLKSIDFSTAR